MGLLYVSIERANKVNVDRELQGNTRGRERRGQRRHRTPNHYCCRLFLEREGEMLPTELEDIVPLFQSKKKKKRKSKQMEQARVYH